MIGTGQGETEFSLIACSDPLRCAARSLFHCRKVSQPGSGQSFICRIGPAVSAVADV